MLTGMPKFETDPVETITYNIAPAAEWSDGVPITCADFQYTAAQVAHGSDIYDRTGYTDIDNLDGGMTAWTASGGTLVQVAG